MVISGVNDLFLVFGHCVVAISAVVIDDAIAAALVAAMCCYHCC